LVRRLEPRSGQQQLLWDEDQDEAETEQAWSGAADRRMAEAAWQLLDRFDDLESDRRLDAALDEARSALDEGRRAIIVAGLPQEAEYVAAAISPDREFLWTDAAQTITEQRAGAAHDLGKISPLVVTPTFYTVDQQLPGGTRSIWFTPPRNQRQIQQYLDPSISGKGLEVILLRAVPPVSPADALVGRLEAILRAPWQDQPEPSEEGLL
jgi:hypothetical protein